MLHAPPLPTPQTISISNGRIARLEPSERWSFTIDGSRVELPDRTLVLPGLVDSHCHLIGLGLMASRVRLQGARSAEECARRMAERARALPSSAWVVGFGWNQEEWDDTSMPTREILDRHLPHHPVVLQRIDSHASWINSRAITVAGIEPAAVPGGEIVLGDDGRPSGLLIDNAMRLAERALPTPGVEEQRQWIAESVARCNELGLTEVHDMNVEPERLESMVRASERGELTLRCHLFLCGMREEWRSVGGPQSLATNLHVVGVKFFADGALGSRGAWLHEPYADDPGSTGIPLLRPQELVELAAPAIEQGHAIATHAIGDAAVTAVLDAYEELRRRYPEALLRVEHAQTVRRADLDRFARLHVLPSVQPIHCTSDAAMADARLGGERSGDAYPWRSLLERELPLLGGSDFPIESPDPLTGIRAFVERRPAGREQAWHGEESIGLAEAVAAYTLWPQRGLRAPLRRGRLAVGEPADLVVLEGEGVDDPDARPILTLLAGDVVHERLQERVSSDREHL